MTKKISYIILASTVFCLAAASTTVGSSSLEAGENNIATKTKLGESSSSVSFSSFFVGSGNLRRRQRSLSDTTTNNRNLGVKAWWKYFNGGDGGGGDKKDQDDDEAARTKPARTTTTSSTILAAQMVPQSESLPATTPSPQKGTEQQSLLNTKPTPKPTRKDLGGIQPFGPPPATPPPTKGVTTTPNPTPNPTAAPSPIPTEKMEENSGGGDGTTFEPTDSPVIGLVTVEPEPTDSPTTESPTDNPTEETEVSLKRSCVFFVCGERLGRLRRRYFW